MDNRGVLIGSIIFVFASFILMMVLLIYETYRGRAEMEQLVAKSQKVKTKTRLIEPIKVQDFSMYRTVIGNEGREMVEIPEGPFTMGYDQGDPDEAPAHPVYLKAFFRYGDVETKSRSRVLLAVLTMASGCHDGIAIAFKTYSAA